MSSNNGKKLKQRETKMRKAAAKRKKKHLQRMKTKLPTLSEVLNDPEHCNNQLEDIKHRLISRIERPQELEDAIAFEKKWYSVHDNIATLACTTLEEENNGEQAACQAGCCYCCEVAHIPIMWFEFGAIIRYIVKEMPTDDSIVILKHVRSLSNEENDGRCAFLIDNKCSVYNYRPGGCRMVIGRVKCSAENLKGNLVALRADKEPRLERLLLQRADLLAGYIDTQVPSNMLANFLAIDVENVLVKHIPSPIILHLGQMDRPELYRMLIEHAKTVNPALHRALSIII